MAMEDNGSWIWMVLMALTLGVRHGFDLDHLATIDAITRTVRNHSRLSRMVGVLFSLGHGVVVTLISLVVGSGLMKVHTPQWLEGFGNGISIFFLIFFGILNFWSVFQTSSLEEVPAGLKSYLAKNLLKKNFNAMMVMGVGALFALSFDTFSQIALFSISASLLSGWWFSGILGASFTLGMMMSDGLNGLFVSTLIRRADGSSLMLSRGLGLTISMFSLVTGIVGAIKMFE
jgi:high-affinity nickel-transport protein